MMLALLDTNIVVDWIPLRKFTSLLFQVDYRTLQPADMLDRQVLMLYTSIKKQSEKLFITPYVLWEIIPQNTSYLVERKKDMSNFFIGYNAVLSTYDMAFEKLGIQVADWFYLKKVVDRRRKLNDQEKLFLEELNRCLKVQMLRGNEKARRIIEDIKTKEYRSLMRYLWVKRHSLPLTCVVGVPDNILGTGDEMILAEALVVSFVVRSKVTFYTRDKQFAKVLAVMREDIIPNFQGELVQ